MKRRISRHISVSLMALILIISAQLVSYASSDVNTDGDKASVDGTYEFTGNGDWYGYTSFLNLDYNDNTIKARSYQVTLPEDGRLIVELRAEPTVFLDVYILEEGDNTLIDDPEWQFGSSSAPISVRKQTDIMQAGTYNVEFWYAMSGRGDSILYWPPGYHEFYHKLTFVTLSQDELAAFEVEKQINALPGNRSITLNYESAVNSIKEAYDSLTSAQKDIVSSEAKEKLSSAVAMIDALKKEQSAGKEQIVRAGNPMKLAVTSKSFKRSKLKKAVQFKIGVTKSQGKVTYTRDSAAKKAGIKVSSTGKVTVPKKCKKGKYIITVKAAGNDHYKPISKKVKITVK